MSEALDPTLPPSLSPGEAMAAASAARQAGRLADAVQLLRAVQAGTAPQEAAPLRLLTAQCLSDLGLDAEAIHEARRAFEAAHAQRDYALVVRALSVLGSVHERLGDHETSRRLLLEALARARETGDRGLVRAALHNAINALTAQRVDRLVAGEPPVAAPSMVLTLVRQLLAGVDEEVEPFRRLSMSMTAATGLMAEGLLDESLERLRACCGQAEAEGIFSVAAQAETNLGIALVLRGDPAAARLRFEATLKRCAADGLLPLLEPQLLRGLVLSCAAVGDAPAADVYRARWQALERQQEQRLALERGRIAAEGLALADRLDRLDSHWNRLE
jgi:tetratricopeptide (TPR) repeat protein